MTESVMLLSIIVTVAILKLLVNFYQSLKFIEKEFKFMLRSEFQQCDNIKKLDISNFIYVLVVFYSHKCIILILWSLKMDLSKQYTKYNLVPFSEFI